MNRPSVRTSAAARHKRRFKANQSNERVRLHTDILIKCYDFWLMPGNCTIESEISCELFFQLHQASLLIEAKYIMKGHCLA